MAARKKPTPADRVASVDVNGEAVLVFKATRPLSETEHAQLADKVRQENEATGVKIVFMPYSCELGGGDAE